MKHAAINAAPSGAGVLVLAYYKGADLSGSPLWTGLSLEAQTYLGKVQKNSSDSRYVVLPGDGEQGVLLYALGEREKFSSRKARLAARKIAMMLKDCKAITATIALSDMMIEGVTEEVLAELLATNIEMATYTFDTYKTKKSEEKEQEKKLIAVQYFTADVERMNAALERGVIIGEAVNAARELINIPGGDMTPTGLAQAARKHAEPHGVTVTVLGEDTMTELGMGGILGVSRGSVEEAQFIVMEYRGGPADQKPIVFAGKGITFDSGGLHIKPSNAMDEMHMDMGGAGAVIEAVTAVARMKLPINLIGLVPAAENMPSGQSYRPGDVLTSMSGQTIEVVSPDAEGRVVLADALTYAERYDPSLVVDVATLTGAVIVALGHYAIGYMTPHEELAVELRSVSETSGDYAWELPLWEEYESLIEGEIGDFLNAGKNREAGTINGGMFLYQFAKKFPRWVHCDIASTMTTSKDDALASGASGSGTRLLIEIARREAGK